MQPCLVNIKDLVYYPKYWIMLIKYVVVFKLSKTVHNTLQFVIVCITHAIIYSITILPYRPKCPF